MASAAHVTAALITQHKSLHVHFLNKQPYPTTQFQLRSRRHLGFHLSRPHALQNLQHGQTEWVINEHQCELVPQFSAAAVTKHELPSCCYVLTSCTYPPQETWTKPAATTALCHKHSGIEQKSS